MNEAQLQSNYSWDTGLLREVNEDSVLCARFELNTHLGTISAGLFAVADGMGGHNAGEIASDLAIRTFQTECIRMLFAPHPDSPRSILAAAFDEANRKVLDSSGDRERKGMGTTLTATLLVGGDMYIAHIGDSRCYIINSREIIQVTKDHSLVQQLVDAGTITAEEARNHPRRNEITRALGYGDTITPDLCQVKLYADDTILLCSDGLHNMLPSDKIMETVIRSPDINDACIDLTAQANLAGGPDNISVIIAKPCNLPSWQAVVTSKTGIRRL
jgi:serine/threonine protein phosphatase PrpC